MIKRILVGLGTSRTATSVTDHGIDIAKARGAERVGLAVTDPLRLDWTGPRPIGVGVDGAAADLRRQRLEMAAGSFAAHHRNVETDHAAGDAAKELIPYAQAWQADLIVAGNSAKKLLLRRIFGETALQLLRESPLPLYLAQ